MARVVVTHAERPALADRVDFNQFVLYDEDEDVVLGEGHTIPCTWDGTPDGLPAGIDGMMELGFALREQGREPDALSAMAIEIRPAAQGGGLSRAMLEGMREIGRRRGLGALLAPVRPSWKERYPLTPLDRYARWTREDGLPFDPWIRTHVPSAARSCGPSRGRCA